MSKHNNNLMPSSHARCKCGRYATIGEWKAGIGIGGGYTCPNCQHAAFEKRQREYRSSGINAYHQNNN